MIYPDPIAIIKKQETTRKKQKQKLIEAYIESRVTVSDWAQNQCEDMNKPLFDEMHQAHVKFMSLINEIFD